jgi:hypothetical protein
MEKTQKVYKLAKGKGKRGKPSESNSTSAKAKADAQHVEARAEVTAGQNNYEILAGDEKVDAPELTPENTFEPILGLKALKVDDELIVVDPLYDLYVRLNTTGAVIWQLITRGLSLEEMGKQLSQMYGLAPKESSEVAKSFVEQLLKKGLVVVTKPSQEKDKNKTGKET